MKFTIDRSKWRCGGNGNGVTFRHGEGKTQLLNDEGYMCCLGMMSLQCGCSEDSILNVVDPSGVEPVDPIDNLFSWHDGEYGRVLTPLADRAICINDSRRLTDECRERDLKELFAEHGHEIEFVGEYRS